MHRSRLVYQQETDTVRALRDGDPYEEPLPPIVFIADATGLHERTRIVAVLTQGQRLDIHGVLLGAWPDGNTITVDTDGTTAAADGDAGRHGAHPADIGRLAIIDLTEAANLITLLAESHTGQPPPPAPTEPAAPAPGHRPAEPPDGPAIGGPDPAPGPADIPVVAVPAGSGPVAFTPVAGLTRDTTTTVTADPDPHPDPDPDPDDDGEPDAEPDPQAQTVKKGPGRVTVTVLGPPTIVGAPEEPKLLPRGLELLVYLAAHDGTAHIDRILEDLVPEMKRNTAPASLHNYVSSLRGVLRAAGGDGMYISRPRHRRYTLDRAAVEIDLWRMRAAIKTAAHTDDPEQRLAALRDAVGCYQGPLAGGHDYLWIESYREGVRRQALDATTALLQALDGQPEQQLAVATPAIELHPHPESLYQAAMHAHHQLGNLDAIRQLRRDVTIALADQDAEPSPDTLALADRLVTDLQTPPRRTGSQPRVGGQP
jgi:DNA-binding SARP family transcriptional activator